MDRRLLPPFDLSQILPVGGSLLVPRSLPGAPVLRELMQVATMLPGQGECFQSVFPLTEGPAKEGSHPHSSQLWSFLRPSF